MQKYISPNRRSFITNIAATGVMLSAPNIISANSKPPVYMVLPYDLFHSDFIKILQRHTPDITISASIANDMDTIINNISNAQVYLDIVIAPSYNVPPLTKNEYITPLSEVNFSQYKTYSAMVKNPDIMSKNQHTYNAVPIGYYLHGFIHDLSYIKPYKTLSFKNLFQGHYKQQVNFANDPHLMLHMLAAINKMSLTKSIEDINFKQLTKSMEIISSNSAGLVNPDTYIDYVSRVKPHVFYGMDSRNAFKLLSNDKVFYKLALSNYNMATLYTASITNNSNQSNEALKIVKILCSASFQTDMMKRNNISINGCNLNAWKKIIKTAPKIANMRGMLPNKIQSDELTLFAKNKARYIYHISEDLHVAWQKRWDSLELNIKQ